MTINRTIGQTPPDRANELFAQLLDTPDLAVELREQLFSALRQELELLANLQEQHLFPVLEKHPETADLVRDARNDTQQTTALLNELESMPKDSEAFIVKVADLRRVFQQHIRNDKNELLPVVLKVLNQEEVEAVVEKVEEEIAEVEQTKRATSRRRRMQAEDAQAAGETMLTAAQAGAEGVNDGMQMMQGVLQESANAASELLEHSTEAAGRQAHEAPNVMDHASQYLQAIARSNRILAHGAGAIALEWSGLRQERLLKTLDGLNDLLACRSVAELVGLQSSIVRQNVEQMIGNHQRLVQITTQITRDATRTITAEPKRA
jgi:hypothetical protein